jgi:uncharacterized membrane protein YphA (DoxX/SURF4 family)
LNDHFDSNVEEIDQYRKGVERLRTAQAEATMRNSKTLPGVPSLRGQVATIESELRSKGGPLLAPIDQMWADYQRELNALATNALATNALATEEQQAQGALVLELPDGTGPVSHRSVDKVLPWFDIAIGGLLILGLFTRLASGAGALFLCAVMSTQWPWAPGAVPIDYQFIETLALFALMATGAGRFGGLDFFGASLCSWCCPRKQERQS